MTDSELLTQFSRCRSQEAFAALVERYIRLVYSACRRQLGDAQLAEDATQMVFMLLSQKTGKLQRTELAGWLLTTSRYTCANLKRSEQRRHLREEAAAMKEAHCNVEANSEMLEMLDEGLSRMGATDRSAIVLRYLQDSPLKQVGEILGLSEDTARKRVDRALDKLREFFRDRGVQTDSAALTAILANQSRAAIAHSLANQIVHAGMSAPVLAPALGGAVIASTVAASTVAVSVIAGVVAFGVFRPVSKGANASPVPVITATTSPTRSLTDRQRELAARIRCGVNMRQIGLAMLDYAQKHHGNFPADFGSLIITESISPKVFICPDSHTVIPPDLANQSLEQQAIWVDQHSNYIYRAQGLKNTCSPDTVVVYEKESDHVDGMNMLWADGHVDYENMAQARQYIKRGSG